MMNTDIAIPATIGIEIPSCTSLVAVAVEYPEDDFFAWVSSYSNASMRFFAPANVSLLSKPNPLLMSVSGTGGKWEDGVDSWGNSEACW